MTSALPVKRGSRVASGTTMISLPSIACAQNDVSRGVSLALMPVRAMKLCRCSSTRVTSAVGAPHRAAANSVMRFSAGLSRSKSISCAAIVPALSASSISQPRDGEDASFKTARRRRDRPRSCFGRRRRSRARRRTGRRQSRRPTAAGIVMPPQSSRAAPPPPPPPDRRPGRRASSARRRSPAARPRSNSGPGPARPAICGSGAGPRDRPCCPCADSCSATLAKTLVEDHDRCHSVRSLRSPVFLSFQFSDVAMRRLTTSPPFWKRARFGIRAQIADQDDLVDAARHDCSPTSPAPVAPQIGRAGSDVGQREQIAEHEDRPFPAIGLAPGDRDGRHALRREDEPGEEGERGRQGPAARAAFAERSPCRRLRRRVVDRIDGGERRHRDLARRHRRDQRQRDVVVEADRLDHDLERRGDPPGDRILAVGPGCPRAAWER